MPRLERSLVDAAVTYRLYQLTGEGYVSDGQPRRFVSRDSLSAQLNDAGVLSCITEVLNHPAVVRLGYSPSTESRTRPEGDYGQVLTIRIGRKTPDELARRQEFYTDPEAPRESVEVEYDSRGDLVIHGGGENPGDRRATFSETLEPDSPDLLLRFTGGLVDALHRPIQPLMSYSAPQPFVNPGMTI